MTAMNTLAAIGPDLSEMPRFDDGMVNIRELIRTMAEALVNEIMDAQAEDACADGNQRNGYRDRRARHQRGGHQPAHPQAQAGQLLPGVTCSCATRAWTGPSSPQYPRW
ncbi:MAG: hypothetical protein ACLTDR_16625 [Adlercreutzia equolifaciens]